MTRKAIPVKKKPAAKTTSRSKAANLERVVGEAFARALSRPLPIEAQVTLQYENRVHGIKAVLDMYAGMIDSEDAAMRDIARKLIDDVSAVVDGQGRRQRLRLDLMGSLDTICFLRSGKNDDDAERALAVEMLRRILDAELKGISDADAETALAVWRDDRAKPKGLKPKWQFLASLCERLGLGEVKADSLERDWRLWASENVRYRDIEKYGGSIVAAVHAKTT
jgi:hypothetical protein